MAEGNVKVSIEMMAHHEIAAICKRLFEEHGLKINTIDVDWVDVSTCDRSVHIISGIDIASTSFHKINNERGMT